LSDVLQPVLGANADEIRHLAAGVVELRPQRLTLLAYPGWVATPSSLGSAELSEVLRRAAAAERSTCGRELLYLVILDSPKFTKGEVMLLESSDARAAEVSDDTYLRLSTLIVWGGSGRLAIVTTESDFSVAIGERQVLETFLDGDVTGAIDNFRKYRDEWARPPGYIDALASADWTRFATLPQGGEFIVEW